VPPLSAPFQWLQFSTVFAGGNTYIYDVLVRKRRNSKRRNRKEAQLQEAQPPLRQKEHLRALATWTAEVVVMDAVAVVMGVRDW